MISVRYKFNECIVIIGEPIKAEGSKTQWHMDGHTDTPNSRGSSGPRNCKTFPADSNQFWKEYLLKFSFR